MTTRPSNRPGRSCSATTSDFFFQLSSPSQPIVFSFVGERVLLGFGFCVKGRMRSRGDLFRKDLLQSFGSGQWLQVLQLNNRLPEGAVLAGEGHVGYPHPLTTKSVALGALADPLDSAGPHAEHAPVGLHLVADLYADCGAGAYDGIAVGHGRAPQSAIIARRSAARPSSPTPPPMKSSSPQQGQASTSVSAYSLPPSSQHRVNSTSTSSEH